MEIPPENRPIHVEYSITRNVMESATEAELQGSLKTSKKKYPYGLPYQKWATNNHQHQWQ